MAEFAVSESQKGVSYGSLIDLYDTYSGDSSELLTEFKKKYPSIYIGRADRFLRTIQRIASPCLPSILGKVTLKDRASLEKYRSNVWTPGIRNSNCKFYSCFILVL